MTKELQPAHSTILWDFCHSKMGKLRCCLSITHSVCNFADFCYKNTDCLSLSYQIPLMRTQLKCSHFQTHTLTQDSSKGMRPLFLVPVKPFLAKLVCLRIMQQIFSFWSGRSDSKKLEVESKLKCICNVILRRFCSSRTS